jgi:uncharacterized protein
MERFASRWTAPHEEVVCVIDPALVEEFLGHRRHAVIGASDDPKNFGRNVYVELRGHGHEPVAVHPRATTVAGDPCYPSVAEVPGELDGAIVMVPKDMAADVVRDCLAHGVPRIWLFKGAGSGAVSHDAVRLCEDAGVPVVAGACPLMFLEPVAWFHRVHRGLRHLNGSLARAS